MTQAAWIGSAGEGSQTPWWATALLAVAVVALGYGAIRIVRAGSTRSMLEEMRRGRRR